MAVKQSTTPIGNDGKRDLTVYFLITLMLTLNLGVPVRVFQFKLWELGEIQGILKICYVLSAVYFFTVCFVGLYAGIRKHAQGLAIFIGLFMGFVWVQGAALLLDFTFVRSYIWNTCSHMPDDNGPFGDCTNWEYENQSLLKRYFIIIISCEIAVCVFGIIACVLAYHQHLYLKQLQKLQLPVHTVEIPLKSSMNDVTYHYQQAPQYPAQPYFAPGVTAPQWMSLPPNYYVPPQSYTSTLQTPKQQNASATAANQSATASLLK